MSAKGVVTLGELVGRVDTSRCAVGAASATAWRSWSRLTVPGPACRPGGAARGRLPKAEAPDLGERCFVYFPQLLELA